MTSTLEPKISARGRTRQYRRYWKLAACALSLGLTAAAAKAENVYRLGGVDGNPWTAALSTEPGQYVVTGRDGTDLERRQVLTSTAPTWIETLAVSIDSMGGTWLRPFFVPDTMNLAADGNRNRVPRGILNNIAVSGCNSIASYVVVIRSMFDGDPKSASFFTASASDDPQIRQNFYLQYSIVDLGTDYPVNRVRFFPRLGQDNPNIEQILADMAPPKLRLDDIGAQDFSANWLPWYELAAGGSVLNFATHCRLTTPTSPWFQNVSRSSPSSDPRLTNIRTDRGNLDVVVDLSFANQPLQWIGFRPLDPIQNWEIAEFQVFGEGHVPRATYITAVLDFGQPMAWGKIRWRGQRDPDASIVIRTRSGSDPDPELYWLPTSIAGESKQVTRQEYERGDIRERFTTLDEEHWSFWSAPYAWAKGLADSTQEDSAWIDGTPVQSPGPSRYLQLQIRFASDPRQTVRLQNLEIQFDLPSAARVVGEVWPLEVARGERTTFTYSVLPTLAGDQGFDRIEVFTLTRADSVRSVRIDGVELINAHPPEILADRIVVGFPRLQGDADSFKLIEIDFDATVVRYGTQFQSWVYDSDGGGVKQLVEAGDATLGFPGNALGVRTDGLGESLLSLVSASPNPFTPNGDGINDQTNFSFRIHELSEPRVLVVDIHDLSGRRVRRLNRQSVIRGLSGGGIETPMWDGMDDSQRRVPPGAYLYRIELDTDDAPETHTGVVVVAY
jgi:hypothetical protein